MSGSTIRAGLTFLSRIPISVTNETRTPLAAARIQSATGMNRKKITKTRNASTPSTSSVASPAEF